jgi:tetratricopeptide (TPR) repeat protein
MDMGSAIRFAAHKMSLPKTARPEQRKLHREWMLFRVLNMKSTVAVVGSGCTISLGYPKWCCFACHLLSDIGTVLANLSSSDAKEELGRIERCKHELATKEQSAHRLMHYIGVCQEAVDRFPESLKDYYATSIRKLFFRLPPPPDAINPCRELVKLPIYRFVTTNYDVELERALSEERNVPFERYGIESSASGSTQGDSSQLPLSFTQEMLDTNLLTRFSLARDNDNRNMVFHCHGRFDRVKSIIASESDYQRWYVSREAGSAFRQTLELLLESNPLLFVGYGMRDEDLLFPLRQLGALDPARKASRPIFGLFPSEDPTQDNPEHEFLYERYGLQVIPFQKSADQGEALCRTLADLKNRFDSSCDDWYKKPQTRPPRMLVQETESPPRKALQIPAFDAQTSGRLLTTKSENLVETIQQRIEKQASVICLVGPGGTGKTSNLQSLLKKMEKNPTIEGSFYWNTHYTNEAFTVLDHVVCHVKPLAESGARQTTRQIRLLQTLATRRFLILVDGCERLLRPTRRPGEGRAYGAGFRQILRILAEAIASPKKFQSVIVFAGRLWPAELLEGGARLDREIVLLNTDRVRASQLKSQGFLASVTDDERTALCSLLGGHSYALLLAENYLKRANIKQLLRALAEQPPKKRRGAMTKLAIDALETTRPGARELLEQMSLFTEPVSQAVVQRCCPEIDAPELQELLKKAVKDCFVLRVTEGENDSPTSSYAVHASLRGYFRRRDSPSQSVVLPDFAMPGYTARTNGVDPGSKPWAKRMQNLFETLCAGWEDGLVPRSEESDEGEVKPPSAEAAIEATDCCRAAFGVLRTQWECSTAARQKSYDGYVRLGIRLANRAKVVAPGTWDYCDPSDFTTIEKERSPLFVAELAWLYNDVAFGLFGEGLLTDAFAVWEQVYEFSRVLESTPPYGEYVVEVLLNLTHTLIELGQITDAMEYLDEASRLNGSLRDEALGSRILGFRGLCEHLRGSLRRADELYATAIYPLAENGNHRAASFFLTFRAGVLLELDDIERAAQLARESRALAEIGDHPDLVGYARIPEADVLVRRGDLTGARRGYEAALQNADRIGARALEAFGCLKLADLSLLQGDAEGARGLAMRTLKASNALGLGLMATRALITLARATVRSGDRKLGLDYLKIAEQQARRQQYGLRLRDAERYLRELGEETRETSG